MTPEGIPMGEGNGNGKPPSKQQEIDALLDEIRRLVEEGDDHPLIAEVNYENPEQRLLLRMAVIATRAAMVAAVVEESPVFVQLGHWAHMLMESEAETVNAAALFHLLNFLDEL